MQLFMINSSNSHIEIFLRAIVLQISECFYYEEKKIVYVWIAELEFFFKKNVNAFWLI